MIALENPGFGETQARSLVKTISWRIMATGITFAFAYVWLGNVAESAGLALMANAVKGIVYYGHERVWNGFRWGRVASAIRPEPTRVTETERSGHALNSVEIDQSGHKALSSTELVKENAFSR